MNTNTQTRLLHHTLLCVGILLAGTPIAHAQGQSLVAKSFTHFGNPAVIFPANKTMPSALKGVIVSPEVGRRTGAVLQAKSNKELMAKLQRKIAAQQAKRVFFPGYYHPSLVNIHTVPYLKEVKKELRAIYPNTKRLFSPFYATTWKEVMNVWNHGPKGQFMSASSAAEVLVSRAVSRKMGYYAVAVQSTEASGRPVHDILLLDVNNAQWISLRKSLAAVHPARTANKTQRGK